ncbi:Ger(x)C family spore germination C-terminal domain-containing protein [Paenibacillus sambharensis]|uniref:Ger(x)C family spore germination C-terminal domain-containing protein n=1 Tax=Paenibacillus sambharensis TaxID=1803190 RepID=UPI003CCC8736
MEQLIETSQRKYKSDFLKFGERLHNEYPLEWRKLADRWEELYPHVEISVFSSGRVTSPELKIDGQGGTR